MRNVSPKNHQLEAFEASRAHHAARTQIMHLPRIVAVIFPGNSTEYSYHCDIPDVKQNDYVIVASPSGNRWENQNFFSPELKGYPTVVRVVRTEETVKDVSKANKWIIQKLDIDAYVARLAEEQKLEVLKAKIARAKKDALDKLEMGRLRSLSPELDALVTELATLTGQPLEEQPIAVRAHKRAASGTSRKAPVKRASTVKGKAIASTRRTAGAKKPGPKPRKK